MHMLYKQHANLTNTAHSTAISSWCRMTTDITPICCKYRHVEYWDGTFTINTLENTLFHHYNDHVNLCL